MKAMLTQFVWNPETMELTAWYEGVGSSGVKTMVKAWSEVVDGEKQFHLSVLDEVMSAMPESLVGALGKRMYRVLSDAQAGMMLPVEEELKPVMLRGFQNFISVIKLIRQHTGLGLAEAKNLAEVIEIAGCLGWEDLYRLKRGASAEKDQFTEGFRTRWDSALSVVKRNFKVIW